MMGGKFDLPLGIKNKVSPLLFIPIRLKNRDKIRKALFAHHIFCPIHWPVRPQDSSLLGRGHELSTTELSLIIDQRYSLQDMDQMVTIIKKEME